MFKMLVFLVAVQPVILAAWLAMALLFSGKISEGLPFAAIALMCVSYFVKGASEVFSFLKSRIKLDP